MGNVKLPGEASTGRQRVGTTSQHFPQGPQQGGAHTQGATTPGPGESRRAEETDNGPKYPSSPGPAGKDPRRPGPLRDTEPDGGLVAPRMCGHQEGQKRGRASEQPGSAGPPGPPRRGGAGTQGLDARSGSEDLRSAFSSAPCRPRNPGQVVFIFHLKIGTVSPSLPLTAMAGMRRQSPAL